MKKYLQQKLFRKPQSIYHPSVYEENLGEEHPFPDFNKPVFSWIAPEFLQHPKTVRWWVIAGIVFVLAVIIEAIVSNWTMLVATLVLGAVYAYLHEFHPPKHVKINLSELGIKLGHKQILYEEIESFWIIYDPPQVKRLYIRLKEKLITDLVLELENQDPQAVRAFLERYLVEVTGVRENFSDILLRIIKL